MTNKVVDIASKRDEANHKRKEEKFASLQKRFEKALPTEETDPKKKLLNIFKKKNKKGKD
ncbi:hypothetical protein [Neptuniibacter sp.]|uniref:hypothetical protein n=1 Tax=Neptuniibacter sp. TaxID=1962643 RepID=UPI002620C7D2|nr:hypothetical protein [Neptuniibacter sp.]MCP4596216.1 hypothetical protein [Neptuniibacter sp.]